MTDAISVGPNRRFALGSVIFLGVIIAIGISHAVTKNGIVSIVFIAVILGAPFIAFVYRLLQRGPTLILDDLCLRDLRSGKAVSWEAIDDLRLIQERWLLGENHISVFTDKATRDRVKLSLDQLSMGWEDIVEAIEERIGRGIPVTRKTAIAIRRQST